MPHAAAPAWVETAKTNRPLQTAGRVREDNEKTGRVREDSGKSERRQTEDVNERKQREE